MPHLVFRIGKAAPNQLLPFNGIVISYCRNSRSRPQIGLQNIYSHCNLHGTQHSVARSLPTCPRPELSVWHELFKTHRLTNNPLGLCVCVRVSISAFRFHAEVVSITHQNYIISHEPCEEMQDQEKNPSPWPFKCCSEKRNWVRYLIL